MAVTPLRRPAASETHRAEVRAEELEAEVHAIRAESRDFAMVIDLNARRAYRALEVGHLETVEQAVATVISLAGRRLRQTGGDEAA